ncbi:DUF4190 domain-containing protein [Agromyces intestinalis]|uniref:DUF4190 domain-containing protein n=1 Tax=Agromyces intestinalis TaxID=2592652 RepID=A0A5C1YEC9_9MICO|nr:DUF4190 domain-containing protein [Agromyces intestinalis]QEO13367.1 DUF4190 domain-containing protein [Agromyces intestinalis]
MTTTTTTNVTPDTTTGFSIAALVLGLVSIFAGFTFVVPIVGLVLGILGLRREPQSRTMAIWGIVLNGVMLAGSLLVAVGALAVGLAMLPFAFVF